MANRFAELAPDFEEEQEKRKVEAETKAKKEALKLKQEEKKAPKPEEGKKERREYGHPSQGGFRGGERGVRRGYRRGRTGAPRTQYVPVDYQEREGPRNSKPQRFPGNNDPNHPFDRHSGTGRGKEVPKGGAGAANWGRPEDDVKYANEAEQAAHENVEDSSPSAVTAEPQEVAPQPEHKMSKRDKKRNKERKFEEKKEEDMDPDGTALTYAQYQALMQEKAKALPEKKVDLTLAKDPKKAEGLVEYKKQILPAASEKAGKSDKGTTEATVEDRSQQLLGFDIGEEQTRRGWRGGRGERRGGRRGNRGRDGPRDHAEVPELRAHEEEPKRYTREEPKKEFQMKDTDFPSF